jgi:hypothetical protein
LGGLGVELAHAEREKLSVVFFRAEGRAQSPLLLGSGSGLGVDSTHAEHKKVHVDSLRAEAKAQSLLGFGLGAPGVVSGYDGDQRGVTARQGCVCVSTAYSSIAVRIGLSPDIGVKTWLAEVCDSMCFC